MKENELEKLPFLARTPRVVARAKHRVDPKPNQREIRTGGTRDISHVSSRSDLRTQVHEIVEEGIHCTGSRKKDETIQRLGSMLLQQILEGEGLQSDLQLSYTEAMRLSISIDGLHREVSEHKRISLRIQELRHLKFVTSDDSLVAEIWAIEADVQKIMHMSEPWPLPYIIDGDPGTHFAGWSTSNSPDWGPCLCAPKIPAACSVSAFWRPQFHTCPRYHT
jgi:hypothetical protein